MSIYNSITVLVFIGYFLVFINHFLVFLNDCLIFVNAVFTNNGK